MLFGDDLFDRCVAVVNAWKPKEEYLQEEGYKKDLLFFMQEVLNKKKDDIFSSNEPCYLKDESGRSLCDIGVNRKVGIELKKGKNGKISKSDINRLQGQIDDHKLDYPDGIIVVLVGDCNAFSEGEIKQRLQRKLDESNKNNLGLGYGLRLRLINKSNIHNGNKINQNNKNKDDDDDYNNQPGSFAIKIPKIKIPRFDLKFDI